MNSVLTDAGALLHTKCLFFGGGLVGGEAQNLVEVVDTVESFDVSGALLANEHRVVFQLEQVCRGACRCTLGESEQSTLTPNRANR